jgi:hypothetical protein
VRRHPDFPDYARVVGPYSDKTANKLTKAIIDFLKFSGWQAERISVTGRRIDNTKIVKNVLGQKHRIGSVDWIKSSMQPGTADISATIKGRSVKIEVKINKDKQSQKQIIYQQQIETAGGIYWIVRNFDDFICKYDNLIKTININ